MLRVLGGHGADLGATDSAGDSALYWAARQGHAAVIRWLVDQGVSLDTQNKVSTTNTTPYIALSLHPVVSYFPCLFVCLFVFVDLVFHFILLGVV